MLFKGDLSPSFGHFQSDTYMYTVELQWLEQTWDHENWCQLKVVPAMVSFYICNMNSRDFSLIYGASVARVFMLLFSFLIFSDQWSLKIENKNNSLETFDNGSLLYAIIGIKE